jgi:hypothetical protein
VLAPATVEDARGMLWTALQDPDPVLIFENVMLYNRTGQIDANAGAVDITGRGPARGDRCQPDHLWRIALQDAGGGRVRWLPRTASAPRSSICARLRPLDDATIMASVGKTRRAVIVDEGWRSGSLSAEISARIMEQALWSLDAPVGGSARSRCRSPTPSIWRTPRSRRCRDRRRRQGADGALRWASSRCPRSGPTWRPGKLVEWTVKPGDTVKRGDIVAVVETQKGAIEIEIFEEGEVSELTAELGTELPVGAPLAVILKPGEAPPANRRPPPRSRPPTPSLGPGPAAPEPAPATPRAGRRTGPDRTRSGTDGLARRAGARP